MMERNGKDGIGKLLLRLKKKLHRFVSRNFPSSYCIIFLNVLEKIPLNVD